MFIIGHKKFHGYVKILVQELCGKEYLLTHTCTWQFVSDHVSALVNDMSFLLNVIVQLDIDLIWSDIKNLNLKGIVLKC